MSSILKKLKKLGHKKVKSHEKKVLMPEQCFLPSEISTLNHLLHGRLTLSLTRCLGRKEMAQKQVHLKVRVS